jgi:hypothetical protein
MSSDEDHKREKKARKKERKERERRERKRQEAERLEQKRRAAAEGAEQRRRLAEGMAARREQEERVAWAKKRSGDKDERRKERKKPRVAPMQDDDDDDDGVLSVGALLAAYLPPAGGTAGPSDGDSDDDYVVEVPATDAKPALRQRRKYVPIKRAISDAVLAQYWASPSKWPTWLPGTKLECPICRKALMVVSILEHTKSTACSVEIEKIRDRLEEMHLKAEAMRLAGKGAAKDMKKSRSEARRHLADARLDVAKRRKRGSISSGSSTSSLGSSGSSSGRSGGESDGEAEDDRKMSPGELEAHMADVSARRMRAHDAEADQEVSPSELAGRRAGEPPLRPPTPPVPPAPPTGPQAAAPATAPLVGMELLLPSSAPVEPLSRSQLDELHKMDPMYLGLGDAQLLNRTLKKSPASQRMTRAAASRLAAPPADATALPLAPSRRPCSRDLRDAPVPRKPKPAPKPAPGTADVAASAAREPGGGARRRAAENSPPSQAGEGRRPASSHCEARLAAEAAAAGRGPKALQHAAMRAERRGPPASISASQDAVSDAEAASLRRSRAWLIAVRASLIQKVLGGDEEAARLFERLVGEESAPRLLVYVESFLAGLRIDWHPGERDQPRISELLRFLKNHGPRPR